MVTISEDDGMLIEKYWWHLTWHFAKMCLCPSFRGYDIVTNILIISPVVCSKPWKVRSNLKARRGVFVEKCSKKKLWDGFHKNVNVSVLVLFQPRYSGPLRERWMGKIIISINNIGSKSQLMKSSQTRLEVSNRHNWPLPLKSVILRIVKQVLGLGWKPN